MASFSLVLNGGSVVPSARLFNFSLELLIPSAPFVPNSRAKFWHVKSLFFQLRSVIAHG